eukprot:492594-Amphidinium_carterae.1
MNIQTKKVTCNILSVEFTMKELVGKVVCPHTITHPIPYTLQEYRTRGTETIHTAREYTTYTESNKTIGYV